MKRVLRAGRHTIELARRRPPDAVAAARFRDLPTAQQFLAPYADGAGNAIALRQLLAEEAGIQVVRLSDAQIVDTVARLLVSGQLVALEDRGPRLRAQGFRLRTSSQPAPPEASTASAPPPTERTWIEIQLLDMEDQPVPDERYWIKLPDGSIREGRLDRQGLARVDGLDPGQCTVRFPDLDQEAAEALAGAQPERDLSEATPGPDVDAARQAATLRSAARDGVPFCEECERRRRERERANAPAAAA